VLGSYAKLQRTQVENKSQNYLVFGLCPMPSILETGKLENMMFQKLDLFPSLREGGSHLLFWVPRKELTSAAGGYVFKFLEYQTMDKIKKPCNYEYYTPLPEPFRIY
jgi:hypothetical protein